MQALQDVKYEGFKIIINENEKINEAETVNKLSCFANIIHLNVQKEY